MKNIFKLNWKIVIADGVIFTLGYYLFLANTMIGCVDPNNCKTIQPPLFYVGFILATIAVIHFIITLITFIVSKIKSKKSR